MYCNAFKRSENWNDGIIVLQLQRKSSRIYGVRTIQDFQKEFILSVGK